MHFCISEIIIDIEIHLFFKEIILGLVEADIGEDEIFEQIEHVLLKELLHVRPQHQTFEEFKAIEHNTVTLRIFRGVRAELPYLLTKILDDSLDIFFVFIGVKQNNLECCSFALEYVLAIIPIVTQTHNMLENGHPLM